MRYGIYLMLLASGTGMVCDGSDNWPVREQETIQKTLRLSGEPMRVVIDNLNGYVHLTGAAGSDVKVVAHKTIRAETDSDLSKAKTEVKLDMTEQPGSVSVEYDAPWRCKGNCDGCCNEHRRFYEVTYDIDVEAPREARVVVSAVNGEIRVDRVAGAFEVNGVNGGIRMSEIAGSGDVHTVNGPVNVQFARNPSANCSFKSVNGTLDAQFQPGLSADLFFKTFNGQVYSDFDVAPMPIPAGDTEKRNGMYVYRSNRITAGRAGHGGPQLKFDTLNGSIRLHQEQ